MTRELKDSFRLVMTGITAGATKLFAEFQVVDEDMTEPGQRMKFKKTDFADTLSVLWCDSIKAVKKLEELD